MKNKTKNAIIFTADTAVSLSASLFALLMLRWVKSAIPGFQGYLLNYALFSVVSSLLCFLMTKSYRIRVKYASLKLIWKFLLVTLLKEGFLAVSIVCGLNLIGSIVSLHYILTVDFCITFMMMLITRLLALIIKDNGGVTGEEVEKIVTMVYGVSPESSSLIEKFNTDKTYCIKGFLSRSEDDRGLYVYDRKVFFYTDDITDIRTKFGIDAIMFTNEQDRKSESDNLVRKCIDNGVYVLTIPPVKALNYKGIPPKEVKDILNRGFIPDPMPKWQEAVKRIFDILVSTILLLIFSPLFIILFIVVRAEDGGPAIYSQERIGRGGKPFFIYKFRTMRQDAESLSGPALNTGENDPRLTKTGRFLRSHHIDELPQLYNVLRGDMSFVGHRPERQFFIDKILEKDQRYTYLYQIRPGVTSYSTLRNGYTDTIDKMLKRMQYDLYYLNNRSLVFDMRVLWETFTSIVTGKKF